MMMMMDNRIAASTRDNDVFTKSSQMMSHSTTNLRDVDITSLPVLRPPASQLASSSSGSFVFQGPKISALLRMVREKRENEMAAIKSRIQRNTQWMNSLCGPNYVPPSKGRSNSNKKQKKQFGVGAAAHNSGSSNSSSSGSGNFPKSQMNRGGRDKRAVAADNGGGGEGLSRLNRLRCRIDDTLRETDALYTTKTCLPSPSPSDENTSSAGAAGGAAGGEIGTNPSALGGVIGGGRGLGGRKKVVGLVVPPPPTTTTVDRKRSGSSSSAVECALQEFHAKHIGACRKHILRDEVILNRVLKRKLRIDKLFSLIKNPSS